MGGEEEDGHRKQHPRRSLPLTIPSRRCGHAPAGQHEACACRRQRISREQHAAPPVAPQPQQRATQPRAACALRIAAHPAQVAAAVQSCFTHLLQHAHCNQREGCEGYAGLLGTLVGLVEAVVEGEDEDEDEQRGIYERAERVEPSAEVPPLLLEQGVEHALQERTGETKRANESKERERGMAVSRRQARGLQRT